MRRDAGAMPPPSVAHYCTWIAHRQTDTKKHTHCWQCGAFAVHRLSPCLCLSCDPPPPQPPPALWPHPLPCPYMVFLRRARRCNLRSKIPLSLCGKFQHTWEDRGEGEERGRGRTRLLSASYIHFSFQRTHYLLVSFFFFLLFLYISDEFLLEMHV